MSKLVDENGLLFDLLLELFGLCLRQMATVDVGARSKIHSVVGVVEQDSSLLEGTALSLNGEQVDVDRLEEVPDSVDDVVLVVEVGPGDGVRVLVEDERGGDGQAGDDEKSEKREGVSY